MCCMYVSSYDDDRRDDCADDGSDDDVYDGFAIDRVRGYDNRDAVHFESVISLDD